MGNGRRSLAEILVVTVELFAAGYGRKIWVLSCCFVQQVCNIQCGAYGVKESLTDNFIRGAL